MDVPFVKKAFERVVVDILMAPYDEIVSNCSAETLIQIIAHLQTFSNRNVQRIEIWQKLQICLVNVIEHSLQNDIKVEKESLTLIVNSLCA